MIRSVPQPESATEDKLETIRDLIEQVFTAHTRGDLTSDTAKRVIFELAD